MVPKQAKKGTRESETDKWIKVHFKGLPEGLFSELWLTSLSSTYHENRKRPGLKKVGNLPILHSPKTPMIQQGFPAASSEKIP